MQVAGNLSFRIPPAAGGANRLPQATIKASHGWEEILWLASMRARNFEEARGKLASSSPARRILRNPREPGTQLPHHHPPIVVPS